MKIAKKLLFALMISVSSGSLLCMETEVMDIEQIFVEGSCC